mgnify:CR=1 FL=1
MLTSQEISMNEKSKIIAGVAGLIIAAIAIAVVSWLVAWLLGLLGITF